MDTVGGSSGNQTQISCNNNNSESIPLENIETLVYVRRKKSRSGRPTTTTQALSASAASAGRLHGSVLDLFEHVCARAAEGVE